jgi:hypothetical protein
LCSLEQPSHQNEFRYSVKGGNPHSVGLKSNRELRTWSACLWYETSSLGSGTITAYLQINKYFQFLHCNKNAVVCADVAVVATYIPAFLAAPTPDGASSNTKQLLGSTLP